MGPHGAVLSTPLTTVGLTIKRDFCSFLSSVLPAFKFKKKHTPPTNQQPIMLGKQGKQQFVMTYWEVA